MSYPQTHVRIALFDRVSTSDQDTDLQLVKPAPKRWEAGDFTD